MSPWQADQPHQSQVKEDCHRVAMVSCRVETIDGSATEGEDYVAVNQVLTFEPYETEKEVK